MLIPKIADVAKAQCPVGEFRCDQFCVLAATATTQQADVQVICLNRSELKPVSPWARLSIWIVDAHRDDRKRFILRADEKLSW